MSNSGLEWREGRSLGQVGSMYSYIDFLVGHEGCGESVTHHAPSSLPCLPAPVDLTEEEAKIILVNVWRYA